MYKLILSWRYLKTRFIALASIVSVTLGVATLIVVNSVMAGFVDQMKNRLHGMLSDISIVAPMTDPILNPEQRIADIKDVIGDDLESVTCVVRTPALLSFSHNGRTYQQEILLMGIDDATFGNVTDFEPFLTNVLKRDNFSFALEDDGYEHFDQAGWGYRRSKIQYERDVKNAAEARARRYDVTAAAYIERALGTSDVQDGEPRPGQPIKNEVTDPVEVADDDSTGVYYAPLPEFAPVLDVVHAPDAAPLGRSDGAGARNLVPGYDGTVQLSPFDPHARLRPRIRDEDMYDEMKDHHTGIILGLAISKRKMKMEDGGIHDIFLVRPGDDAQIVVGTVGQGFHAVVENCTVVDFYSSNMHEYDSKFAFMPLSELQKLRGMVDPMTGKGSVSTIQIKLKKDADLNAVRDKLIAAMPPSFYNNFEISTWEDTQRPLLSAVRMELTILNILLFMIIAVAGFGILATFFMIVVEKTKDIGILKALGAPSTGVMSIFLGYGVSLGAVGTGVGIVIGLLFVRYINQIADFVSYITGQEIFDSTIYYFKEIPTMVSPVMVVWVAFGAIMIAVIASVLPALRAARLHPVEALRYE